MSQLPPLSLYIHIPWCVRKCPYCDFNSHAQNGEIPQAQYVDELLKDLDADLHWVQQRPLHSIFIGGGTPSLFDAAQIKRLLDGVAERIPFEADIEITMEANPGTVEHDDFNAYRAAGITRISMGVQSFAPDKLTILGRIHGGDEAKKAAASLASANYNSFNLDLMHGLPDQTLAQAMSDIETAASLNPPHLSWYQLTIEPNTLFHSRPPALPDDEALWDIYQQGQQRLQALGYRQYEISAYAKPGFECRHNLNYWEFGDYLGIGCGAHGKITLLAEQQILRSVKVKHPKGYLAGEHLYQVDEVLAEDRPLEYLMNRLRLMRPIAKADFAARTGVAPTVLDEGMREGERNGLVLITDQHWELTDKGHMFVNELLSYFC
ncbi:radical SAM family heme chaperone HemW [Shewanella avicenniae]|uniref:Heme chaperone HemW n=1 Tax=Shewanella avicenniae TaxID=2814294 RepID=A0ABX7QVJ1_9GAMM|nr:radical SAM family heme chaperone HemW [Shewanella avicenniae]QSX35523.1 radical SAM family heme chaperone HemW [Shewanella avicenniae]